MTEITLISLQHFGTAKSEKKKKKKCQLDPSCEKISRPMQKSAYSDHPTHAHSHQQDLFLYHNSRKGQVSTEICFYYFFLKHMLWYS